MRRSQFHRCLGSLALLTLGATFVACEGAPDLTAASKPGGGADALWDPGTPNPQVFDFETNCGVTRESQDDPTKTIMSGTYQSLPIVVEGTSLGAQFRVITQATVNIVANLVETTQEQQVQVLDATATGSGIIAIFAPTITKSKAEDGAKENSGTKRITRMGNKEWFKLTNGSTPEFKDVLCGVSGVSAIEVQKGTKTNINVTFEPALVGTINPRASLERLRAEVGSGKSFHVTANVSGTGEGLATGTVSGITTVREVPPTFNAMGRVFSASAAFEIVNEFPGGAYTVGLSRRQVFYIDTNTKTLTAIVDESDRIDDNTKRPMPPVYLIRSGN